MSCNHCANRTDHGPNPYVVNIEQTAMQNQNFQHNICKGDAVYAPPNHRRGTVHRTKADAEREE